MHIKVCYNLKNILLRNATAKSVDWSIFLKNLEKRFCNLTYKKHIENLTQHLSEKFIGDNLSIRPTDIVSEIEVCRFSVSPRTF